MKNAFKAGLLFGVMIILGAGGLAAVARAKGKPLTTASVDWIVQRADAETSETHEDDESEVDDAQKSAQYQSLAKITPQQAQKVAEAAVGGTASKVELGNEDGNLVYEVMVSQTEVLVDAGNGNILHREDANVEENDAAEAPIPRSSIQVPDHDDKQDESAEH